MADITTTLNQSTNVSNNFIVEPFNAPTDVVSHARKFFPEEVYNLAPQTTLYKFLLALLGDSGVNGMKKAITYARTQQALTNIHFEDLDALFAGPLFFNRQNMETYDTDPSNSLLTDEQWLEVHSKDANYRSRANDYVKGINLSPTQEGYNLIARSATGYDSEIYEQWRYYDDLNSDSPIGYPNLGNTTSRNEIVVLPKTDNLDQTDLKYLNDAFNRIKSVNSIISFVPQGSALVNIPINQVVSSSDFYYVQKIVTGNPSINYPDVSETNNTWIISGSAVEAPTYAFGKTQESITYAPILSSSASTVQMGPFNQTQQAIFGYLQNVPSQTTLFSSDQSFVENSQNLEISTPWAIRQDILNLFANGQYPIGYFALNSGNLASQSKTFWASKENYIYDNQGNGTNLTSEYIQFNLQTSTPVNMVEFEISQKPIDVQVQYLDSDQTTWIPVSLNNSVENTVKISYTNSTIYQWQPGVITFDTVTTNGLRLVCTRKPDIFPFNNPTGFPWSIELRHFKCALMIGQQSDFVSFPGIDVLGNSFYTKLKVYNAYNVNDNQNSFWQCQSNPSQFAVESLYFDISDISGNAQTIDQIYLDPLTIGNLMHVYYSNDQSTDNFVNFGNGDVLWYDNFSGTGLLAGTGIWANYNLIWNQTFPSFEKTADLDVDASPELYSSLYEINNSAGIGTVGTWGIAGNITSQQYGGGDTIVTFAKPGKIIGSTASYFELDVCLQGGSLNTGYSLQYTLTNSNTNPTNIQLASYYNGTSFITHSVNLPSFNSGDQIGIRNDIINNQAIAYAVNYDVNGNPTTTVIGTAFAPSNDYYGADSYGTATYAANGTAFPFNNYGYTSMIVEDPLQNLSLSSIQFRKTVSNSTTNWDYKLWNPINKHYRLQKGYLNLPNPITAKYIKLEFTKLTPTPYESIYNPNLPEIEFNAYPSWVVAYINDTFNQVTSLQQINAENVNYNLVNIGVQKPNNTLMGGSQPESILKYVQSLATADITQTVIQQYNSWFSPHKTSNISTPSHQIPQIYPNTLYQEDTLFNTVQNPNPLTRIYSEANTTSLYNYAQETPLNSPVVGPITARGDNTIVAEKNYPDLWFPRICRHAYQTVRTKRDKKFAYTVAIKTVGFYKKNRSIPTNDLFYFETLADISNADSSYPNTFVQNDWKFSVPATNLSYGKNIPDFAFENFDGTIF